MRDLMTCALNGADLFDLDDRIYIEDIIEEAETDHETDNRAAYGMFPMNVPHHQSIVVTVKFMVKERIRYERNGVVHKIQGWAKPGWLTTNIRPNQRLYVFCTKQPKIETFDWTQRMEIQFTAYGEAYWQDIAPLSFESESDVSSASVVVKPMCTHECFFEAQITPTSGETLTAVTITVNGKSFQLTGLSVVHSHPLSIYYDELHLLHIESNGTSLLSKRSAASADDLILNQNVNNTISMTFDVTCAYTVYIRRLWE